MSLFRRISMIIKGCVSSAGDRIERIAAEEELRLAQSQRDAAKELANIDPTPPHNTPAPKPMTPSSKLTADYRLLGVRSDADLYEVEAAWRRLAQRADPKRFPSGSEEEKRAAEILSSVNHAYECIREELNPTEGRFGQLEL
ncbi:MAG: J domain-containing protein [Armatimonadota bacterium]|nr:hypothetical protein [bacterium]